MRACVRACVCVCVCVCVGACVHETGAPKRKTFFVTTAEGTHLLPSVDEKWAGNSRCMCALLHIPWSREPWGQSPHAFCEGRQLRISHSARTRSSAVIRTLCIFLLRRFNSSSQTFFVVNQLRRSVRTREISVTFVFATAVETMIAGVRLLAMVVNT